MRVVQFTGPFVTGQQIQPNIQGNYVTKYIKFGIQTPQAPPLSEVDLRGTPLPYKFKINNNDFVINANDILEFDDLDFTNIIIIPQQNMDAYTIIDIGFIDEEEST